MASTQTENSVGHTPGPWRTTKDGFSGKPEYPYSISADPNGRSVIVVPEVWGPTDDMREANARLIAAAPDLLAALKALTNGVIDDQASSELVDQADAAIAKATGANS